MRVAEADKKIYNLLLGMESVNPPGQAVPCPRVFPVVQSGFDLVFPSVVYRAVGGRFVSVLQSRRQREIDYYVTIQAVNHEHIGAVSDELISAVSQSSVDLSGPVDGFELAEGLDDSIGGYYTRQYFVTLRI